MEYNDASDRRGRAALHAWCIRPRAAFFAAIADAREFDDMHEAMLFRPGRPTQAHDAHASQRRARGPVTERRHDVAKRSPPGFLHRGRDASTPEPVQQHQPGDERYPPAAFALPRRTRNEPREPQTDRLEDTLHARRIPAIFGLAHDPFIFAMSPCSPTARRMRRRLCSPNDSD